MLKTDLSIYVLCTGRLHPSDHNLGSDEGKPVSASHSVGINILGKYKQHPTPLHVMGVNREEGNI